MAEPRMAIRAVGLSKTFGTVRALRGIDLAVPEGQSLALFGPNGAGKSTLVRIIATLAKPTSGQATVAGYDVQREARDARRAIGVLLNQDWLYGELTLRENLRFYGRMHGVDHLDERIDALVKFVGLSRWSDEVVRAFSRGMRQRAALARCILPDPTVLLLDEADSGLDRDGLDLLRAVIAGSDGRKPTALLATHNVEFGWSACDRAITLERGRIVRDDAHDDEAAARLGASAVMGGPR